jgi:hypothetical protein
MKIESINYRLLRNEEHLQFHTGFKELVELNNPGELNIEEVFAAFLPHYAHESEAIDQIRKSEVTHELTDADNMRDNTCYGMTEVFKAATRHFQPAIRQAASNLAVIFDHFSDLTKKSYDEETTAIVKFIEELNAKAADVATVGLTDWVAELQANNTAFVNLTKTRYTEESGKTQLKMRQVRGEVDSAYRTVVNRINALIIVNGESSYSAFVTELNKRIEHFAQIIALRDGRNAKDEPPVA